jgi:nucleotide-binding universal stress UspA family protein
MKSNPIVVGVDGGAPSLTALHWAAAVASRRNAPLRVVLAYHWRMPGRRFATSAELQEAAQDQAELVVDEAMAEARNCAPGVTVTGAAVLGDTTAVLLRAATTASLLVVGTRSHYGFATALLGSVSQQVAMHAVCPVAVVRGRAGTAVGPVVVGVDSSPLTDEILAVAFEQASERGCGLSAVRAFTPPPPPRASDVPPLSYGAAAVRRHLLADLERDVAPWTEKYPAVPTECLAVEGDPTSVLVDRSRRAQLVVVGSRGHGGFAGLLLGSVGSHLLHHADCPVLIVRKGGTRHVQP